MVPPEMRAAVFERALDQCEYCRLPGATLGLSLTIDHIVAIKHGGPTTLENLAAACLRCNLHKGADLATLVRGKLVRLFHPRQQAWHEHFVLDGQTGRIRGKSEVGVATTRLLNMNGNERPAIRRELLRLGRLLP